MGSEGEDQHSPLITNFSDTEAEQPFKRTGTIWTAIAHIITGVIGAGVLSLAWSTAQLGWVAGPLIMVVFAAITIVSANLLCDCYRSPDPGCGPTRNRSYVDAVQLYLGEKHKKICAVFLYESLYGCAVAYVITSAASVKAIEKSNCYHKEGHEASCSYGDTIFMLLFGAVQIIVSQIPDFHNMAWLSVVAAIMSFTYSSIGLGLGFAKVIENREIKGSIVGVTADSVADKVWLVLQAVGDIAFAYPYSVILLEIQDTLKSPPPERETMKKASTSAIIITTFFYLCCGCFGYAAFGSDTPGNLLTGFGFYEPYWLVDFANACIVLHLVGGYQKMGRSRGALEESPMKVQLTKYGLSFRRSEILLLPIVIQVFYYRYSWRISGIIVTNQFGLHNMLKSFRKTIHIKVYSQPVFATVEGWIHGKFPNSGFVSNFYSFKLPLIPAFQLNPLRLCFRTGYVVSATVIAMSFPYFNQVLGLLGALNFWPLVIYFPVEMYFVQRKIRAWTTTWVVLRTYSIACLIVSILALLGSVQGLIRAKLR
ncbi:hypothetical protein RHGRI_009373 [Rhododendron griersonianum]|uniref:Amino acid transporter transmembrane domain-containing protein n=1 Tax=Rhododendron griersonianum TaxID=479676 RepID=A0AAV6KF41_9ERIC|nr:hypothetical protein RHGRI_009373 [Rhododendron griersonianum]